LAIRALFAGICCVKAACELIDVIGRLPETGGALSLALLALAAASDLEDITIIIIIPKFFFYNIRVCLENILFLNKQCK
jgi:hypothetical protein